VTDTDTRPFCAFHSDRRAGVVCQRCDKPICPACMHQASVGFHCPDCVREGRQKVVRGNAAFGRTPSNFPITIGLIVVNVIVYFVQVAAGDETFRGIPIGNKVINDFGVNAFYIADEGEWYRVITGAFLHANLFHLLLNMYGLYLLGSILERSLGRLRFALVYGAGLIGGSAGALMMEPDRITVGASGAIYGLMAALVVVFRNRGISIMQSGLGLTLFINFVFTLSVSNISVGGHIGGFVGGGLAALVLVEGPRYVRNREALVGIAGALIPVLFVAALAAASAGV
jgi:membrane associated rhomboid family serine protease